MPCLAAAAGLVAGAIALPGCGGIAAADIHTDPPARHHRLSHDGSRMIVLRDHRKGRHFDVMETASGASSGLLRRSFRRMVWGEDSDIAYAIDREKKIYRLSFGADGRGIEEVALTGPGAIPAGERPTIVKFPTPSAPFFLVRTRARNGTLYRCDPVPGSGDGTLATGCRKLFDTVRNTALWLLTAAGGIAARVIVSGPGERVLQTLTPSGDWDLLFPFTNFYSAFVPIGGVQPDNTVWALSNRNRDRIALVRLDLRTGEEEIFFEHDRFDLRKAFIVFDRAGRGTPLLATWDPGHQAVRHFDDRVKAAYEALYDKLGRPSRIEFGSIDLAMKSAVVEVRNPDIHRRWYLLDLEGGGSRALSASDLESYARPAAPSRPVSFAARDGLELHGYLTLPQRRDPPPPMILMLHGGPWSRYRWPASSLVRFLGSEGYAVLRLNFRGSAGYDRTFLEAGNGALFGRMQQDVLDGAAWAVAKGYAKRGEIALFGGSFGGLLTLAMLGRHPAAFRAGIALNAITDAVDFWQTEWKRPWMRPVWRAFLGARDVPVAALTKISPVNNFHRFAAPVLLIAGTRDRRVSVTQSRDLFLLLKEAGKPVEFVEYRGAAHSIWSMAADSREHVVEAIGEFLGEHLPVEPL